MAEDAPNLINIIDPQTQEVGSIPQGQLEDALSQGYEQATPEQAQKFVDQQKYSTPGQQVIGGLEAAGRAGTFGLSTGLERGLGVSPEAIKAREENLSPLIKYPAEIAGLAGSALIPGVGEANVLEKLGAAGAKATGLGAETTLSKIGSSAVKNAIETGLYQTGDEIHKVLANDPNQSAETALTNIGLSTVLGGGFGASFGAVNPLWKATMGPKVGQILKAVTDRAGGIEGQVPDAIQNAIHTAGIDIAPEVKMALSKNPEMESAFQVLQESTSKSGMAAQEALKNFKSQASDGLLSALGKTPEDLAGLSELSEYDAGTKVRAALADELKKQYEPISEIFKQVQTKFKDVPLSSTYQDVIQEDIGKLIQEKGYYLSPSTPAAKIINTTLEELGGLQTLDDLRKYTSLINEKTNSPELWKIGGDLRRIFRRVEGDVLSDAVGQKAPELFDAHALGRSSYQDIMNTIDTLNDRLHVGKYHGPDSFISALKEMSPEDVLRRMSGKGDADLLNLVKERFPASAGAIKEFHVDNLLKNAAAKAGPNETISPKVLFNSLDKMSPELKDFAFPEASRFSLDDRFNSIRSLLENLPAKMNTSGTAKTLDALWSNLPGTAIGMATMLMGHNPAVAFLLGALTKYVGREAPDAIRLGMLRYLGSSQPLESEGFKSMIDFIHHTIQGENLLSRSAKNIFRSGIDILPSHLIPSDKEIKKLDKRLQDLQENQQPLFDIGGKTGHYLPQHASSMTQTSVNAVLYLNSLRPPTTKQAPLDQKPVVSQVQKAAFDNALQIAEQPLVVMKKYF
jgi:hypothetical protein